MPPAPSSSSLHSVTAPARLTSSSPRRYTACTCTPPAPSSSSLHSVAAPACLTSSSPHCCIACTCTPLAPSSSSLHNVAAPAREIFEGPLFSKMDYSSSSCNMPNQENDTHENINEDIAGHNPTVVDEYMPPRSSRQPKKRKATDKRSEVWDHFESFLDENKNMKAKCMHCAKTFCGDTKKNGIASLRAHMKSCKRIPASIDLKQTQLNLQSGSSTTLSTWVFDQEEIRKALAFMIIVDELPFKFVENEGFQYFLSKACPRFKIPSRWTVSRDCFRLYMDEKNLLKALLKSTDQRVCFTTDTWSSLQRMNYMSLTAHYIDKDWRLHKKILNFCTISSHRGRDIGWEIEKCLHEWEIEKVFTITVDNASSNDSALGYLKDKINQWGSSIRSCKYMHMRCIAHVFNLVVQDGLKEIGTSVKRIRNAVRYIRNSPARLKKFKECSEYEKISTKSLLCLDVSTRWNSTYLMLDAALKFEKAFSRFDMQDTGYRIELLSDDGLDGVPDKVDWVKVKRMLCFLKIFYDATCKISGSLYVTSNVFLHEIYKIHFILKVCIDGKDEEFSRMSKSMKEKFDKYWGDPKKMNKLIFIAVILDPRYKLKWVQHAVTKMYGVDLGRSMAKELHDELLAMCNDYKKPITMENAAEHTNRVMSSVEPEDDDPSKAAMKVLDDEYSRFHTVVGNDVDKFLKEDIENGGTGFDILVWWRLNEARLPILSQVARDILAVPISTVASESAFSTGGRVLDAFRSSLTPKVVQCLICGQDWFRKSSVPINIEEALEDIDKLDEGLHGIALEGSTD